MMGSGASGPTSGGCVSTNLILSIQWSPNLSSSSWVFCPHRLSLHPLLCPHSWCL
ncbi:hypothetical protein GW17_00056955 [Ensete ventricosum]|nr:hypothetical protein GW17_00056955 [Ensete ventricosum]RZR91801.1 hypothetical protein BHM03_00019983 [Ensete ventricosum]